MRPRPLPLALVLAAGLSAQTHSSPGGSTPVDFRRDILPVLADRCFRCHGPDAKARKAKLRLDTFAGATAERDGRRALVPGDPAASAMVARLRHADPSKRMPPARSKQTVTEREIARIEEWIRNGGAYAAHWDDTPPRRSAERRGVEGDLPAARVLGAHRTFHLGGLDLYPASATQTDS
ncbi:MAG: hypothetical protein H6837_14880 [Planctomycetes bacterium]|nr:hypothetical protein [Planctomycetota bacterium]